MRLINVHTREIKDFLSDTEIQRYAILSHTWAEEEVSFEDYQCLPNEVLTAKKGYPKIDYCCLQAAADGLDWAWVDTCCIDKRSSAELSEAINSMFRWYKQSVVCYAYFTDVGDTAPDKVGDALVRARWFTRGWTLQELLAPSKMELYAHGWKRIGTRSDLSSILSEVTGIEVNYLCGRVPLEGASVSKRMSWAARRETTRTEDLAYCLLGLFDVNMPLLYGEGKKAFRRLQEEILRANPTDHTLFAWGKIVQQPKRRITDVPKRNGTDLIPWDPADASQPLRGLFAESPKDFMHSAGFSPWAGVGGFYNPYMVVSRTQVLYPTTAGASVKVELPVLPIGAMSIFHWPKLQLTQLRPLRLAILLCEYGTDRAPVVALPLQPWGDSQYGRTDELLIHPHIYDVSGLIKIKQHIHVEPQRHRAPQRGDFLVRRWGETWWYEDRRATYHKDVLYMTGDSVVIAPESDPKGRVWASYFRLAKTEKKRGFAIVFSRVKHDIAGADVDFGPVSVSFAPLLIDEPKTTDVVSMDGFTWYHKWTLRNDHVKPLFERRMALPEDTWSLDLAPFPTITVRVKRISVGPTPADIIDVVDITILGRSL